MYTFVIVVIILYKSVELCVVYKLYPTISYNVTLPIIIDKLPSLGPGRQNTRVVRSRDPEQGRRKVPESTTQPSSKLGIPTNKQNIGIAYAKTLNTNEKSNMFEVCVTIRS